MSGLEPGQRLGQLGRRGGPAHGACGLDHVDGRGGAGEHAEHVSSTSCGPRADQPEPADAYWRGQGLLGCPLAGALEFADQLVAPENGGADGDSGIDVLGEPASSTGGGDPFRFGRRS